MNSKQPLDELPDPLRDAVNQVRTEPVPQEALDRALSRAQQLGPVKVRPWYWQGRKYFALAGVVAALLLIGFTLWGNRGKLGPRQVAQVDAYVAVNRHVTFDVEKPQQELDPTNFLPDGATRKPAIPSYNIPQLQPARGGEVNRVEGIDKSQIPFPDEPSPGTDRDAVVVTDTRIRADMTNKFPNDVEGRSGATKKRELQAGGGNGLPVPMQDGYAGEQVPSTEAYAHIVENPFQVAIRHPLSTFSSDVHTAAYSNIRRFLLQEGRLPPPDAVRIAEMINYFPYAYAPPKGDHPVAFAVDLADCPWNPRHHLLRIGLKGEVIDPSQLPPRNLVFLVDTSGSMSAPNRLPLLKESLKLLVAQLGPQDRVALVAYAGSAGLVLPSTAGSEKKTILDALDRLESGGSTNGGEGIVLAYKVARDNFLKNGLNRVVLGTDGDFNVGVTSEGDLIRLIEEQRKSGIFLTLLGYGMGNLKDSTLEKLAYHGAGHYAYIDTLAEARKVFVEQGAALHTIARDVKLQVEFNPRRVAAYRLIGYENRLMRAQDFNDDRKHAGSIGVGHTVTALYEIVPAGEAPPVKEEDDLKYQRPSQLTKAAASDEWLTVKMRYKQPTADTSKLLTQALSGPVKKLAQTPADFRFAAAVAELCLVLRRSEYRGSASLGDVRSLAKDALGADPNGHRAEFLKMVDAASAIARRQIEKRGDADKQ